MTGGASGIGKAVALALGSEGANVFVIDLHLDPAKAVVDQITSAGGHAVAVAGNVGNSDDVKGRWTRQ